MRTEVTEDGRRRPPPDGGASIAPVSGPTSVTISPGTAMSAYEEIIKSEEIYVLEIGSVDHPSRSDVQVA